MIHERTQLVTSPEQIDDFRRAATSRWLARLFLFGEFTVPEDRAPGGEPSPLIVTTGPEIGPALAASAIGCPVNRAERVSDGLLCHYWPNGAGQPSLRGLIPETFVGIIDDAWSDDHGIIGSFSLLGHTKAHDDLDRLDKSGLLGLAGLCLAHHAQWDLTRPPWLMRVARVTASVAISLNFASMPLSPGSRVLRRLDLDEDARAWADEYARTPPERTIVPAVWWVLPKDADGGGADVEPGNAGVGTGNLANQAVTPTKRSPLLALSQTVIIPAGGPNALTFTHNLGVVPHVTVDAGDINIFTSVNSITTTQVTVSAYNFGPTVERTVTAYCW